MLSISPKPRNPDEGALAPFRHPAFRAIWIATLVANFGSQIQGVGAAWLMTSLSHSERMVALVQASQTAPIMLLAMLSGALADSYDRRQVMLAAQWLMLVASAVLAALAFTHHITPVLLLLLTLMMGIGGSLQGPSWQASIREQVPLSVLPAAVSLNSIGFNLARSIGPALGGLLMALAGPAANFTANALSYIGLIVVLTRWRPNVAPPTRQPLMAAMKDGVVFAARTSAIRRPLLRAGVFGTGTSAAMALMPLIARTILHGDQNTFGLILGAFGAGSVGGALVASALRPAIGNDRLFGLAGLLFGLGTIGSAIAPNTPVAMLSLAAAGAAWVTALSTINIVVQMTSPPPIVGRCLALYHMCAFGGMTIGSYVWGAIAEHWSVSTSLLVAGVWLALTPLLSFRFPLPSFVIKQPDE